MAFLLLHNYTDFIDKHIGQNCGDDSQNSADDGEYTELLDYITKKIHVVPLSFFAVMIR